MIRLGYDVRYGARPLQRTIQTHVLNPLSKLILEGGVGKGDEVLLDFGGEGFSFRSG